MPIGLKQSFAIRIFKATTVGMLGIFLLSTIKVTAQSISVTPATTTTEVQDYVENVLLGSCVTASNVTYSGEAHAAAIFDGNATVLGLNGGILLTSGQSTFAVGPDNSNTVGFNNAQGGDPDLTSLASNFTTYDAAILEFDFIPQSDTLRFNYIFGSEEYTEYVNSGYNDVFGFFISGPGIAGPYTGGAENIALIPGSMTPVAIDNVNNGYSATEPATGPCTNCAYYVDNSSGPAVQYDAHTVVLTAQAVVTPCETYHIKIAVADAGDGALDSGVFLEEGSFSASGEEAAEVVPLAGVSGIQEGCDVGTFVFRRLAGANNSSPLTVGYNVSGTATPGVDYDALPGSITIPAGQDSVILNIQGILDFVTEGNETVVLELLGGGCSCNAPPSVSMDINDNDIQLSLSTSGSDTICLGQTVNLSANPSGSVTPYTSGWDNGAPAGDNISVSPSQTTTYTYTVTDACGGQSLSSSETVVVVSPRFSVDDDQQCFDGNDFSFTNTDSSGVTITHFWDFDDGGTSTDPDPTRTYSSVGTYTVTHTVTYVETGCVATADTTIEVFQEPTATAVVDQNVSCSGGSDGAVSVSVSGGAPTYIYDWSPNGETTASVSGLSVGTYSVEVTDANGCSDDDAVTLIQEDLQPPAALCQDTVVQLNAAGSATISATAVDNGSIDNCGIASLVVSPNAFSCAEVGPNPVVLTVTDLSGNVATCNAIVTVEDTVPPTATCQDLTVTLDGSGNASVDAAQIDNGSSDNCTVQSITLSPNSFTCADVGSNTVTLTVTDAGGNISTCDATVTVEETTDPTAVCQNLTVQLDATGNVSVTGAQVGSGSTDNCSVDVININPANFNCSDIGDNSVTVTVFDVSGNSATCSATVTVEDDLPPTAVCQDISVYLDASGSASIIVSDVDGGSTDNCGIDNVSATPTAFTCSEIGINTVELTVSDASGNTSTCTADVTVLDTISPTAICQDITVQLDANGTASVTANQIDNGSSDNCSVQSIDVAPNSFDCTVSSPAQVELTVTDDSGNISTCTATVTLEENTPPTAVCQDVTVQLDASGNASIVAADVDGGSTDNCGITNLSVDPSTFDCSNVGQNTVTLTVEDANGNSANCTATVTVEDNVNPVATCQDVTIQLDASGTFVLNAADVDAGSTDNCTVSSVVVTPNEFDCSNLGTETVTLTVTDGFGNTATCTADVTVLDTVPPTAVCQDITVQLDAGGNAIIAASQIDNGSSDVCGINGISIDNSTFGCSNLGANTVQLTVEDNSGNTSTCTAQITVEDNVNPTAACQNLTVYLDGNGLVSADATLADGGSTDNCSIDSVWLTPADFTCAELGQDLVTLTVADASGNTDDCITVISVLDTIAPTIIACPSDIIVEPASSDCNPSVSWVEPTTDDNCTPTLISNFSPGDNFSVGTTTVVYTAEDQSGNTANCLFDVTIVPSELVVSTTSPTYNCGYNISCNGAEDGEGTATVSGGCEPYTFLWSDNQSTQTAISLAAGEHVVVITDANGTQVSDTILLTEPEPLVTDSIISSEYVGGVNISCAGNADGSIALNVLGGADCQPYSYSWIGPNGFTSTSEDLNNLEAGNYVVTATDVNGCTHSDSIVLVEPEPLNTLVFPTTYNGFNISCFGLEDGFINLEVIGGTAGYSYQWSNAETVQDIDSLSAGFYSVLVTDTNGCETTASITLTEPTQLDVAPIDSVLVTCNGDSTGQFQVQASGGVPTYSYAWSNGDMDPTLNDVGDGIYQVMVTDLNGCQDSLELEMTEPTLLEVTVDQVTDATCYGYNDGSATIFASGGEQPYAYNWQPSGQNTAAAIDLLAGDHIYTVTDANGCTNSDTVVVAQPDEVILVTSNDTTVCPGTFVPMSVEVSGGGGTYLITWDNDQGFGETYEPFISQTSNIPVVAVDQNGCESAPNSVIVTTLNPVSAEFDYTVVNPCTSPFLIDFSNSSTNASSFSWTFANGDSSSLFLPSTSFDSTGTYSVTMVAESDDGCVDSLVSSITIDELPVAAFHIPDPEGCYPINVALQNQSTNANSYFWDFGDGETSTEVSDFNFYLDAGAYTVTLIATNNNGCSDTLSADSAVFAYPRPVADFVPILIEGETSSEYYLNNTSIGATDYFWTFGNGEFSELFEPTYDYPDHGSYSIILFASNQYGCEDTAMISVEVDLIAELFVPNAMAIGEPGEAGKFLPKGTGIGTYHAWIYDLWGNLLWESTALQNGSPAEGWNGRYNGELVPQGAYAWKIEAIFKDGEVWEGMQQSTGKPKNIGSVTVLY